jgi:hypothetical protein
VSSPDESKFDSASRVEGSSRKNAAGSTSWTNGRPWTSEEEDELREIASTQTIPTIAKGLGRSEMSVRLKLKSLRFEYQDLAGFKTKDLAEMLSVTIRQVRRWRRKGYLAGVNGRITEESFAKFCKNHAEKIPYRDLKASVQLWLRSYGYRPAKIQLEDQDGREAAASCIRCGTS